MDIPREPPVGSLEAMPVFLGCSNMDPFIPLQRVEDTSTILGAMGAQVNKQIYPGMGHTINQDEIAAAQKIINALR